jgi:hypothetical protein
MVIQRLASFQVMSGSRDTTELVEAVLARARLDGGIDSFEAKARQAHNCSHPVRLYGRQAYLDTLTGELTDDQGDECLVLKACGNRRKTRCPACSDVYRNDARHLVMAGLAGGKGVPESATGHPMAFATLTAPSFGVVHTRSKSGPGPCHPLSPSRTCPHGVKLACFLHHDRDDTLLGQPICPDCYRYEEHVVFHGLVGELWRRTTIYTFRALARLLETTPSKLNKDVRLSFIKVVEYQARGAVHLHVVVRADGIGDGIVPPPPEVTAQVLGAAIVLGSRAVAVVHPVRLDGVVHHARWGLQIDVSPIDSPEAARRAARYVSKYVTSSTESTGALDRRLRNDKEVAALRTSGLTPHHRRLVECAWRLSRREEPRSLCLRRCAHALGFKGDALTKSRRYSTSFGVLRRTRFEHRRREALLRAPPDQRGGDHELVVGTWRYVGIGYGLPGDHLIAEMRARESIEMRREGWQEITSEAVFG